ncbi:Protein disulfide-isomerase 5-4 [Diplonema papillatum]|nr:Protein disulfide-isomerase 5-4 [Diplonema papillatum]
MTSGFHSFDGYRSIHADLTRKTTLGGVLTCLAIVLCNVLFMEQARGFLNGGTGNNVRLLDSASFTVDLNFDVTLLDLPCEFTALGVYDSLGHDLVAARTVVNESGGVIVQNPGASSYTEDELDELEAQQNPDVVDLLTRAKTEPSGASLNDITEVTHLADFVLVMFKVDWCPYCRRIAPEYGSYTRRVNEGTIDLSEMVKGKGGDRWSFRVAQVDCEANKQVCTGEGISAFPTLRLYKRGHFVEFKSDVRASVLNEFIAGHAAEHHRSLTTRHAQFATGCRLKGTIAVPATPGVLRIGPKAHLPKLNQSVSVSYVNVSHVVNHLYFGRRRRWSLLDGRPFVMDALHRAPVLYVNVVSTVSASGRQSFSMTHSQRTAHLEDHEVPLIKVYYDVSPIEVVQYTTAPSFYHFITSALGVVGGTSAVMRLLHDVLSAIRRF